jgi:hypothetical protein
MQDVILYNGSPALLVNGLSGGWLTRRRDTQLNDIRSNDTQSDNKNDQNLVSLSLVWGQCYKTFLTVIYEFL